MRRTGSREVRNSEDNPVGGVDDRNRTQRPSLVAVAFQARVKSNKLKPGNVAGDGDAARATVKGTGPVTDVEAFTEVCALDGVAPESDTVGETTPGLRAADGDSEDPSCLGGLEPECLIIPPPTFRPLISLATHGSLVP